MEVFTVINAPTQDLAQTNRAILNKNDKFAGCELVDHIAVRYPGHHEAFVFSVIKSNSLAPGQIAFNGPGRKWASLQTNAKIEAAPYKFDHRKQCLNSMTLLTDFSNRSNPHLNREFDTAEMSRQFSENFTNQAFTVGQLVGFVFMMGNTKVTFELKVKELEAIDSKDETEPLEIGLTTGNTIIMFDVAEGSPVKLTGKLTGNQPRAQIFTKDWDFANMGIGGLSEQFNTMFRRAFLSRMLPPQATEELGLDHTKGILLYGPPGTGKTLIARQIGTMLLARPPKIVNGPEVLNKYVGESEANIRALFKEAEDEQAKSGIYSGLHLIIFDEIDAICKARGASASSAGVGDNVVNQLLSKIDGVNALNNVLLIGMTNRKDLIDEALLRPGRFEVQIEVGLPNASGRLEIFKIHTKNYIKKNVLDSSVSLEELASLAKNFTGAEIKGLVKAAWDRSVNRVVGKDLDKLKQNEDIFDQIKVTRNDFMEAMQFDVKPALGAAEEHLKALARPIIEWDPEITNIRATFSRNMSEFSTPSINYELPYFIVLTGEPRSGLTTLAANMAKETNFPFIKFFDHSKSSTESGKIDNIRKLFEEAAKSELSCIVIDNLDVLFEYSHIGPRFLNSLRSAFFVIRDTTLRPGKRMLVICTCRMEKVLEDLSLTKTFNEIVRVPSIIRPDQVSRAMAMMESDVFNTDQQQELMDSLQNIPFKMGIKELELLLSSASKSLSGDPVKQFVKGLHSLRLVDRDTRLNEPFRF